MMLVMAISLIQDSIVGFAIPLLSVVTFFMVYLNWVSMKFFVNSWDHVKLCILYWFKYLTNCLIYYHWNLLFFIISFSFFLFYLHSYFFYVSFLLYFSFLFFLFCVFYLF
jgi:hypothetical protein